MRKSLLLFSSCLVLSCTGQPSTDTNPRATPGAGSADPQEVCRRIAADIEDLRGRFVQLQDFRAEGNLQECTIRYEHRCRPPTGRGGWTGAVPDPGPDGVWFYICLWDPNDADAANAQIHTQPALPEWRLGERRVTFLIREGERAPKASGELMRILTKHGMR
jgi:hypothetical protein